MLGDNTSGGLARRPQHWDLSVANPLRDPSSAAMTARLKSPRLIVSLTCIRPRGQVKSSAFSIYPRSSPRRRNVARSLQKNLSKEIWKIGAGDARNINVAAFWKTVPSIKQHLVDVLDRDHMGHVSRDTVEQSGCPAFSLVLIVEPILTQQRRDFGSNHPSVPCVIQRLTLVVGNEKAMADLVSGPKRTVSESISALSSAIRLTIVSINSGTTLREFRWEPNLELLKLGPST